MRLLYLLPDRHKLRAVCVDLRLGCHFVDLASVQASGDQWSVVIVAYRSESGSGRVIMWVPGRSFIPVFRESSRVLD